MTIVETTRAPEIMADLSDLTPPIREFLDELAEMIAEDLMKETGGLLAESAPISWVGGPLC